MQYQAQHGPRSAVPSKWIIRSTIQVLCPGRPPGGGRCNCGGAVPERPDVAGCPPTRECHGDQRGGRTRTTRLGRRRTLPREAMARATVRTAQARDRQAQATDNPAGPRTRMPRKDSDVSPRTAVHQLSTVGIVHQMNSAARPPKIAGHSLATTHRRLRVNLRTTHCDA